MSLEGIKELCLCGSQTTDCMLGECERCPWTQSLTLANMGMLDEDEITFAVWESGDLIKKTLSPTLFLKELVKWVTKWIPHDYIRRTQAAAIHEAKMCEQRGSIVLHFDFAENWTALLPNETQSYHWHEKQISIFTCVATTRKATHSFAIRSDDMHHDACCALGKVHEMLDEKVPIYCHVTYVSDGAASHFKNRYQLYELCRTKFTSARWIFSATGHGKNACDCVGGLVKHHASLHNLRSERTESIRSVHEMVSQLSDKLKNVTLLHAPAAAIEEHRQQKSVEWKSVPRVPGIQSWHVWMCARGQSSGYVLSVSRTSASQLTAIKPF
ncbi:uncharacterized protein LOC125758764 [Rhipicephalus sanguineus]|uniref:uncharacterized protein LOC125758764 n=1 Tax=Rhipicephalus sanguineus TaxID=34632 RepID=UPI0020C33A3B|nr:uncharacterized protein LOC125758764 [Rhipicephalus sanguineus]